MFFFSFGMTTSLADAETQKKFFEAERHAAWVRAAFLAFGYLYLVWNHDDPRLTAEIAWPVLALITAYTGYVLIGRPYLRYRTPLGRYATTILDALLSTVWIGATGGWDSSWYPLYLAMTAATAFRFNYVETLAAAGLYSVLYAVMLLATGTLAAAAPDELALRILFILVIAVLSGPLARGSVEQIRARVAIEEAARKSQQLDHLKNQFFANVSHELRTPLSLIRGPVQRQLATPDLPAGLRDDLMLVERNAQLLLQQVNNLLDLARLDAEAIELAYARLDLVETIRLVASYFDAGATERDQFVQFDLPASLHIEADADKLQRIVLNLVANAFKFNPEGGVIRCSLRAHDGEAVLVVEDSGPGIPVAAREVVFERFRQVEGEPSGAGGVGLGLAIVKEFAELHGGRVHAGEATIGGARFEVRLPLEAPPHAALAEEAPVPELPDTLHPQPAHAPTDQPALRADDHHDRPLVLVVEDHPVMSAFIASTLRDGYRVETARDGVQGLERARRLRPDLIVTDLMMPHASGQELIAELREDPDLRETPVIVLTATSDETARLDVIEKDVHDHLAKPFQPAELRARVDGLIRRRRESIARLRELAASLERRVAERTRQVEQQAEQLRLLAAELSAAEQRERHRLAVQLHDHLQQLLVSAKLGLEQVALLPPDAAAGQVERVRDVIDASIAAARQVTVELYPPVLYEAGLAASLEWFGRHIGALHGLQVEVQADPAADPAEQELRAFLFVSVKELLLNVVKHAGTDHARIYMRRRGAMTLIAVEDEGVGCPPEEILRTGRSEGFGLFNIRERLRLLGGNLIVEAQPGRGCRVCIECPVETAGRETAGQQTPPSGSRA